MSDIISNTTHSPNTESTPPQESMSTPTINTFGLTDLGYKIFLDRYALKDLRRDSLAVGDIVIAVLNDKRDMGGRREVSIIERLEGDNAHIVTSMGERFVLRQEYIDKPLEITPSQLHRRVAKGVASVESTDELRHEWTNNFTWLLDDWKFVPGGRIMTAAGSGHDLSAFNCLPPDQEILTADGYRPIAEVEIGDLVVTHKNRLRKVLTKFERETEEDLYIFNPKMLGFDSLRVTGDHKILVIRNEWINRKNSKNGKNSKNNKNVKNNETGIIASLSLKHEPEWIKARDIKEGDYIASAYNSEIQPAPAYINIEDYVSFITQIASNNGFEYLINKNHINGEGTVADDHTDQVEIIATDNNVNNKIEITEKLCYLIGRWLGNGYIDYGLDNNNISGIKVIFRLDELKEAEYTQKIIEEVFGAKSSLTLSNVADWYSLEVESHFIGTLFDNMFGRYGYDKALPSSFMTLPNNLTKELLRGLFQSAPYMSRKKKQAGVTLSSRKLMSQMHTMLMRLGYLFSVFQSKHNLSRHDSYSLTASDPASHQLMKDFSRELMSRSKQNKKNIKHPRYFQHDNLKWVQIKSIDVQKYTGTVLDIEVDEDHSFVSAGVVVSNCFVIDLPTDSRDGVIETLSEMAEIMSRGGGVGINVSSLRPKNAYVKGVNGRSSGAVSFGALYSFMTGLISQAGCVTANTRIQTNQGLLTILEVVERLESGDRSLKAWTHMGWRPVTDQFRNGIRPTYKLTTELGYSVEITEEHPLMVFDSNTGQYNTKKVKDINLGDNLAIILGNANDNADYQKMSIPDFEYDAYPHIDLPEILDERLAYIIGFYMGNGYLRLAGGSALSTNIFLSVPLDRLRTKNTILKYMTELFGKEPSVYAGDGKVENISISSRPLGFYWEENNLKKNNAYDAFIPESIFKSPRSVIEAFIGGWFAADGCNRGKKNGLGIDTISENAVYDIQKLLLYLGIPSRVHVTDRSQKGWNTLYRVTVSGAWSTNKMASWLVNYTEKLEDHPLPVKNYSFGYPYNYFSTYRPILGSAVNRRIPEWNDSTSQYGLDLIRENIDKIPEDMIYHTEMITNCIVSPVESINYIGDIETFDITVDDIHLVGFNGIYGAQSRRGALMLILNDWHPDILDFINSKREAGKITNANISVGLSDVFMEAVKNDGDWHLQFPDTTYEKYDTEWDGNLERWLDKGYPVITYRTLKARDLWKQIIESAWSSAEPGLWFRERANKLSNSYYYEDGELICTNPCVTGDTRLHTQYGLVKAIDLYNKDLPLNVTVDNRVYGDDGGVSIHPAVPVFKTSDAADVYEVVTRHGYKIKATDWHKLYTNNGKKALKDIKIGEKLMIQSGEGQFGTFNNADAGLVMGLIVGDNSDNAHPEMWNELSEHRNEIVEAVYRLIDGEETQDRSYTISPIKGVITDSKYSIGSQRLQQVLAQYDFSVETKHKVPEIIWQGTKETVVAYLRGLFETDGAINVDDDKQTGLIELSQSNIEFLEEIQMLLANFGIFSSLNPKEEEQYGIVIGGESAHVFMREIGFMTKAKNDKWNNWADDKQFKEPQKFETEIIAITYIGKRAVYDTTQPNGNAVIFNGIVSGQCGEQPLSANAVCNLGAINLSKFSLLKQMPSDETAVETALLNVDWDNLKRVVHYGVRFLDNVIDHTYYVNEANRVQEHNERRVGLGIMGLAELMIRNGVRYGSEDSVEFIDAIMHFIARESYIASASIAKDKGSFNYFDADKFLESGFMHLMDEDIREIIKEKGVRNVTLTTVAPTGCVAPSTLISNNGGMSRIDSLGDIDGDKWQDINLEVIGDRGIKKATKFFVNGNHGVINVKTKHGFSLTATDNHRIRVIDEAGEYDWRRMDHIKQGDTVVLWRDTASQPVSMPKLIVNKDHLGGSIKIPKYMTPLLAELVGIYMGNGHIKIQDGLMIISNKDDQDFIDRVTFLIKEIFGVNLVIEHKMGSAIANINGYVVPQIFDLNGFSKLNNNRGEGMAKAFIPDKILGGGRDVLSSFMRGLFETSGSIVNDNIELNVVSKTLAQQVQIVLLSLNVVSSIKVKNYNENYREGFGRRAQYTVSPINKEQLNNFINNVGFVSSKKRNTLVKVINSVLIESVENSSTYSEKINDLINRGAFLDQVEDIEHDIINTYDISVPDGNTYVANGFVSHNTISTLTDTSGGIEPYFSFNYYRQGRLGIHKQSVPLVTKWLSDNGINVEGREDEELTQNLPSFFITAMELTPEEHVKTMAAAQRWVDSSISKTCNVPNEYTIDQTSDLYMYMYDTGCKGGTIYRDGSRNEQVLHLSDPSKKDEAKEVVKEVIVEKEVVKEIVKEVERLVEKPVLYKESKRPDVLYGITFKVHTPYSTNAYVTVNEDENGNPYEVFITVGKAGSDLQAQAESIGRLISKSLQMIYPSQRRQALSDLISQLGGIGGTRSSGFGARQVRSLPDAVSMAIQEIYLNRAEVVHPITKTGDNVNGLTPDKNKVEVWSASTEVTYTSAIDLESGENILATYSEQPKNSYNDNSRPAIKSNVDLNMGITTTTTTATTTAAINNSSSTVVKARSAKPEKTAMTELCPNCQNYSLIREEGCKHCSVCGHSEC